MVKCVGQRKMTEEALLLLQKIKENADAIWYLDGREYIKVQSGNQTIEIMVWYSGEKSFLNNLEVET